MGCVCVCVCGGGGGGGGGALHESSGFLARYVKLRVVHAPGMPGTFAPPPRLSDPDMHPARA